MKPRPKITPTMERHFWFPAIISLFLAGCTAPKYTVDVQVYSQTVDLQVMKTFYAQDGDAIFRAYVVNWEGKDVPIVSREILNEGDFVPVRIADHPFPRGAAPHRLLSFSLTQPMSDRLAPPVDREWARGATDRGRKDRRTVDLDVLEVFSVQKGEALFRAYRTKWKGQDIVVQDTLSIRGHKKGDIIKVSVNKDEFPPGREPAGQEPHRMLRFNLSPVLFGTEGTYSPVGIDMRAPNP